MNAKVSIGMGIVFLVISGCSLSPGVSGKPAIITPESTRPAIQAPINTAVVYPTDAPTETATATADPCTVYLAEVTRLATQFDVDMIKVKGDLQSQDWNELGWDASQILNFALSYVGALEPPSQFQDFHQAFLAEIQAYIDGATAYLMTKTELGASKFLEGDILGRTRLEVLPGLSCSN